MNALVGMPQKPVGAVTAALAILRCLGRHPEPLRLSDIVRDEGLNSSTALNILRTLEYERLVSFDRQAKRYALADGLVALAAPLADRGDPVRRASAAMAAAAHDLHATIGLWRRVGDEVELLHVADCTATMRIAFTIGRRLPMLLGAMGRLVAAREPLDDAALARHFAAVRWAVAPDFQTWLGEVADARVRGAAIDPGNINRGVLGVAVPVEREGRLRHLLGAAMFDAGPHPDSGTIIHRLNAVADVAAG